MPQAARDKLHLGFLRIVATEAGYVGGMLVTNRLGRPLEFQCTTPVKANRTQEILYGPTLKPFLFSELIGVTLIDRLQVKPDIVLIDQQALLDLRKHVSLPIACLLEDAKDSHDLPDESRVSLGAQSLQVHVEHTCDVEAIQQWTGTIPGDADLREPLDRVREALEETLRSAA
ncbi:MAG: hypothetical protein KDA93_13320 [Planctomycetaceae bacterium]|nr:hypothetical protein [Planctomycetaceae bacterium]